MRWPIHASKIKTVPTSEPLDLTETKRFLDIDASDTNDDSLVAALIKAARDRFEDYTGRRLITQDWYLYLNDWPGSEVYPDSDYEDEIELPGTPLISVTAVKYYDQSGIAYTFAATNYHADVSTEPGRIVLAGTATWPSTTSLRPSQGIEIEYKCGYGAAYSNVPPGIQLILQMLVQHWFHNRSDLGKVSSEVQSMMDDYRILYL